MERYSCRFLINFRDGDLSGRVTMNALVDFMQEAAREHAERLEVNYSALQDQYYWIIVRTKIVMKEAPKVGETIRMETFIEGLDRLYSVRRFNIYNEENECLGYILGYYLLMSKEQHRPVKLKSLEGREHLFCNVYEGEKVCKISESLTEVIRRTHRQVYSSEIDSNQHMNNAHYIRWIVDTFTTEELKMKCIQSLQIQYVKEVREGDHIEVIRGIDAEGRMCIIGRNQEEVVCFISVVSIDM